MMIFALHDLARYRLRRGIYGADPASNIMAIGHTRPFPTETLQLLRHGDLILCQRLDSILSWSVMYFGGQYGVDHCAVYLAQGQVMHMTLTGVRITPVRALTRGARVLPIRLPNEDGSFEGDEEEDQAELLALVGRLRKQINDHRRKHGDHPPPYHSLALAGLGIVLGLHPAAFRFRHYADLGILAAAFDLGLWWLNGFPMAFTLWLLWAPVPCWKRVAHLRALKRGLEVDGESHPGLFIRNLGMTGGQVFPGRPIQGHWKIRVWPSPGLLSSLQRRARRSPSPQPAPESSADDQSPP